ENLAKSSKSLFNSLDELNLFLRRTHPGIMKNIAGIMDLCHYMDKRGTGKLTYDHFKLVLKDLPLQMTAVDIYAVAKILEDTTIATDDEDIDAVDSNTMNVNYTLLENGLLKYIKTNPIPEPFLEKFNRTKDKQRPFYEPFQLSNPKYFIANLRLITFDNYKDYPGHFKLTIQSHISVYTLAHMVIEHNDYPTKVLNLFREKVRNKHTLLDQMKTLEQCGYQGGDTNTSDSLPTYTIYYDYILEVRDCPILKCDYYFNSSS
ncbi:unnamed protein product, partial [Didymodactylos carnosus]